VPKSAGSPAFSAGDGQAGAAIGLAASSWLVVVYALIGSVLWNYAVRPLEERDLEARFSVEYWEYRDRVQRWIPTFAPRHEPGNALD
jgi:protein-S-isoprenylcysteine O-methyltransferase Ste14